jgi:hypothetical protein
MIPYKTKSKKITGTNLKEVAHAASLMHQIIKKRTKRQPYIRSAYFRKEKIFLNYFWEHLRQKAPRERYKRLKFFGSAIELIEKSKNMPVSKPNPNKNEILHRFAGITREGELFYVQIKENKRRGKYFMSCFPPE